VWPRKERELIYAFPIKEKTHVISHRTGESIPKGKDSGESDIANTLYSGI